MDVFSNKQKFFHSNIHHLLFSIEFVLYSCQTKAYSDQNQLRFIKQRCDGQKSCEINVWHGGFAACPNCLSSQCPGSAESQFSLWLRYECRGGQVLLFVDFFVFLCAMQDRSTTSNSGHICARPTTRATSPPTTRRTTRPTTTTMMMCQPRRQCFLFFCWNVGCGRGD